MKYKIKSILATLSIVVFTAFSSLPSSASSQTIPLTATPNFGDPIVQGFLENYKIETAAISPTQTAVTPEGSFVYYTWSLDLPDAPCPEASMEGLHLRASNSATTEGDPDWSQIGVYTNDG